MYRSRPKSTLSASIANLTTSASLPHRLVKSSLKQSVWTSAVQSHPLNRTNANQRDTHIVVSAGLVRGLHHRLGCNLQVLLHQQDLLQLYVRNHVVQPVAA